MVFILGRVLPLCKGHGQICVLKSCIPRREKREGGNLSLVVRVKDVTRVIPLLDSRA